MKIDVGGGALCEPGYINLDPVHGDHEAEGYGSWRRKAQDLPWPAPDASCEAVRASHVMEHIPAGQDRIDVMNEAYRVLVPGGTFTVIVPLLCANGGPPTWQALADPTHVSFWIPESFDYFVPHAVRFAQADYGIKLWKSELGCTVQDGWLGTWIGVKP